MKLLHEIILFSALVGILGFFSACLTEFILFVLGLNRFKPHRNYKAIFNKIGQYLQNKIDNICPFCLSVWVCWWLEIAFVFAFDIKAGLSLMSILQGLILVVIAPAVGMSFQVKIRETWVSLRLQNNAEQEEENAKYIEK